MKKKPQIDRSIRSLSEKKKEKKLNISVSTVHTFFLVLSAFSVCQSPASSDSVVTHSHFPVEVGNPISEFPSCGFFVFDSLRKRNNRIRVFLSPKKEKTHKICSSCPSRVSSMSSRVSTVSESYPNPLTYCLVNDTPRGVSDMYPTRSMGQF